MEDTSYEDYVAMQGRDDTWWYQQCECDLQWVFEEYGVAIANNTYYFDLYYNYLTSDGSVTDEALFATKFWDRLCDVSAVWAQAMKERILNVTWSSRDRTASINLNYLGNTWFMDDQFQGGLFVGCNIEELMSNEGAQVELQFEDEVKSIIEDIHIELLQSLKCEDEYRMSREAYEEWRSCQ